MSIETIEQIAKRLSVSLEEALRIQDAYRRANVRDNVEIGDRDAAEAERVRKERKPNDRP